MGIDRPGRADTRTEDVEEPPAEDLPPEVPPGSFGQPSRLESLRAAREAQEARRAELGRQTEEQETGTEQLDEREIATESLSTEPSGEEPDARYGPEARENTSEFGGTTPEIGSDTGERERETDDTSLGTERARPGERGERLDTTDAGEDELKAEGVSQTDAHVPGGEDGEAREEHSSEETTSEPFSAAVRCALITA